MTFPRAIELQKSFNEARDWGKDTKFLKDFLLNICEEAGEAWSIIKWIDGEKQKEIIDAHKDKFEDFIGDSIFLVFKIAWMLDIDPAKAYEATLQEYEKRFPADKIKELKHGNPLAGGIDDKGE
ncbi:hypothetical protein GOV06_01785 [Candidatus Woesearchaeota archaeon]|nr:hypothetical protein [Candidatus Woesearchaeota archaeon]